MELIKRILRLQLQKESLETQKENLKLQSKDCKQVGLDLAVTNILLHSAKTNKNK